MGRNTQGNDRSRVPVRQQLRAGPAVDDAGCTVPEHAGRCLHECNGVDRTRLDDLSGAITGKRDSDDGHRSTVALHQSIQDLARAGRDLEGRHWQIEGTLTRAELVDGRATRLEPVDHGHRLRPGLDDHGLAVANGNVWHSGLITA